MNLADLALNVITTINSAKAAELQRADYEALLKGHDWQYQFADDQRAWRRGHYERQALVAMQQRLDPKAEEWNRYAPEGMLGGRQGQGQSPAYPAGRPMRTVTAKGDTALVASNLVKLRGTSNSAASNDPLATISAGGWHHAEVRAFLIRYFGTDQDPRITEPLATITTKHRDAIVTVKGEDYLIADIGMRMLQPRELYRAQGFPESYVIDRGADGSVLPKDAQVRMCGNSVCPPVAAALVAANYAERAVVRRAA